MFDLLNFQLFLFAWFITHFDPIRKNIDLLYCFRITDILIDVISCFKCLSFWLILVCTLDFFSACLFSAIALIYDTITERN